ncbi:hypothetical protein [Cellulomonas dongxiuzhuiae]|uniref:Lipocalin-like domain-containing protein n=1 Tax=Cellulomonas dongxiuzhuiae TaxID=2819979 RepID=A0ABX8GII8_9CELL|nr:hypothetical protein [Cellulomonas dongxiuzhuiae]MBO3094309.1 hypothetical protein [Cellulomonas dongxiuzhuiae]QWC15351.1 hypothetical protein KKR89_13685 [Cellulomonas dongxiuzhuiae]
MRRRPTALAASAVTVLLLSACTGDTDADPGAATGGTTPPSSAAATSDPGDEEPVAGGTTEVCLRGTWRLDLAAMQDDLRETFEAADDDQGAVDVTVDGTATYEFADGGTFTADLDSSSAMTMSADGSELTSTSRSTGGLTGRWALAGDQLSISDIDSSGLDVTTSGTLDGEELEVPKGSADDAIEALPPTASTATCSTSTLTLVTSLQADASSDPVTMAYTLRR